MGLSRTYAGLAAAMLLLAACAGSSSAAEPETDAPQLADVIGVEVRGEPGAYTFDVTIRSPDTGCTQYADWWEVVSQDGNLLYRRILGHSHVDEQPFTRSGGPVPLQATEPVWIRAHMAAQGAGAGFGGQAQRGTVESGFAIQPPEPDFATELATAAPLPDGCAF